MLFFYNISIIYCYHKLYITRSNSIDINKIIMMSKSWAILTPVWSSMWVSVQRHASTLGYLRTAFRFIYGN